MKINLAKDFSPFPVGRYSPRDGDFTGQSFRERVLLPAILKAMESKPWDKVYVNIDDVRVFGSSFLEEAFGGLVRESNLRKEDIVKILRIEATKSIPSFYKPVIFDYIEAA